MKRLVFGALLAAWATATHGATYVVDLADDPADTIAEHGILQTLATPLSIAVGDTVEFHVGFTGGAALHPPRHPNEITVALLSGADRQAESTTSSFALTGASGFVADHAGPVAGSDCCIGLYGRFHPTYQRPFGPVSFTGFDAVVTLTGQAPEYPGGPVVAVRTYTEALFYVGTLAVPEPASWALLTIGFAGIGLAARRRRPALAA